MVYFSTLQNECSNDLFSLITENMNIKYCNNISTYKQCAAQVMLLRLESTKWNLLKITNKQVF